MSAADGEAGFDDSAVLTPEQIAELLASFDTPPELPDFPPDEDDLAEVVWPAATPPGADIAVPMIHRTSQRTPEPEPEPEPAPEPAPVLVAVAAVPDVPGVSEVVDPPASRTTPTVSAADAALALSWLFR